MALNETAGAATNSNPWLNLAFAAAVALGAVASVVVAIIFGRRQARAAQLQNETFQRQTTIIERQLDVSQRQTDIQEFQAKHLNWNIYWSSIQFSLVWNQAEIIDARRRLAEQDITFNKEKILEEHVVASLNEQTRVDLRIILNHLDLVAIGLENGTFDEKMMYHLYGYLLVNYHEGLKHFIKSERPAVQTNSVVVAWYWLTRRAKIWENKMAEDRERVREANDGLWEKVHALGEPIHSYPEVKGLAREKSPSGPR